MKTKRKITVAIGLNWWRLLSNDERQEVMKMRGFLPHVKQHHLSNMQIKKLYIDFSESLN